MKTRATLLATSLLVTGVIGALSTADAAVKPVCNVIVDPAGDAGVDPVPGADGDDIVSADVASDGTTLTGVIRTAALAANDPQAPMGRSYFVEFSVKGSADLLFVSARTYPTGTKFVYGYSGVDPNTGVNTSYTLGDATGVVDVAKKEVRISAPVKGFVDGAKAKLVKGAKLGTLASRVYRQTGQGVVPSQQVGPARVPLSGLNVLFDDAAGSTYVVGTPSCVVVGK